MFIKATFKWPQQPVELCYTTITKRTADADAAQVQPHYHYSYYYCSLTTSVATRVAAAMQREYSALCKDLQVIAYVHRKVLVTYC
jgi:hypothetical protein